MEMLPPNAIMNILSRLPVKCLLRFRCQSKSFCSLIDSQEFIKIHLKQSIETDSNLSLFLSGTRGSSIVGCSDNWTGKIFSASFDSLDFAVELDHPFKNSNGEIVDTCNGLIALRNRENDSRKDGENDLALWNPSTKKHIILPKIWIDLKDCECYVDGFGYDATSDDYKFVRILQFGREIVEFTELAVYSLKTNSWRRVRINFPYIFPHGYDGTFADGHVYWLAAKNLKGYEEDVIVALDLQCEEFHEVQLPTIGYSAHIMFVGTFKGCLYFSCLANYPIPVDIWLMKKSWIKSFSFPREGFGDYLKVLAYSKCGKKVLADEFWYEGEDPDNDSWELFWYNIQSQRAEDLVMIDGVPQGCHHTIVCVDSLVSLPPYIGRGVQR